MEQNDLIEDDDGPWGAMIVLAATKLEAVLDEQGINRTSIHRIVPCNFAEMLPCCSHYF